MACGAGQYGLRTRRRGCQQSSTVSEKSELSSDRRVSSVSEKSELSSDSCKTRLGGGTWSCVLPVCVAGVVSAITRRVAEVLAEQRRADPDDPGVIEQSAELRGVVDRRDTQPVYRANTVLF